MLNYITNDQSVSPGAFGAVWKRRRNFEARKRLPVSGNFVLSAYVGSDPINNVDPSGLKCTVTREASNTFVQGQAPDLVNVTRCSDDFIFPGAGSGGGESIGGGGGAASDLHLADFQHPNLGPVFGDCVPAGSAGRRRPTVLSDRPGGIDQAFEDIDRLAIMNRAFALGWRGSLDALPLGWVGYGDISNFRVRETFTGLQLRISGGIARIDILPGTRVTYNRVEELSRGGEVVHYGRNVCGR